MSHKTFRYVCLALKPTFLVNRTYRLHNFHVEWNASAIFITEAISRVPGAQTTQAPSQIIYNQGGLFELTFRGRCTGPLRSVGPH